MASNQPRVDRMFVGANLLIHCTPSWMWGSRGKNYSKCMGYCSTFNADNSAVIHWILTEKMSFKGTDMEIIWSNEKE